MHGNTSIGENPPGFQGGVAGAPGPLAGAWTMLAVPAPRGAGMRSGGWGSLLVGSNMGDARLRLARPKAALRVMLARPSALPRGSAMGDARLRLARPIVLKNEAKRMRAGSPTPPGLSFQDLRRPPSPNPKTDLERAARGSSGHHGCRMLASGGRSSRLWRASAASRLRASGEGVGAEQRGDGVRAEVDGTEGGELGLEVEVVFGGRERLKEALVGHADKFDLGGEVGERELVQQAAFGRLEDGRVVAVLDGVVVAGLGTGPLGRVHGRCFACPAPSLGADGRYSLDARSPEGSLARPPGRFACP